jgi:hypothetical protein
LPIKAKLSSAGFILHFGGNFMPRLSTALLVAATFIGACAPRPDPVVPEPVYDKFGNLEDVCVSDGQLRDPNYQPPLRPLPRCEDRCDPDEQPTFTVAGQWPVCVRRPDYDGGDGGQGRDPNPNGPPRTFG